MIPERLGAGNVGQIQDIFDEYSRMRQQGIDTKSVLNTLRPRIEALSKPEREELAGKLRAWEAHLAGSSQPAANQPPAKPMSIKPLQVSPAKASAANVPG